MKIERAIEILNPNHKEQYDDIEVVNCACRMGMRSLYKQIPMEVTDVHLDEYYCPACGAENGCSDGRVEDNYCPRCGQALRWEE